MTMKKFVNTLTLALFCCLSATVMADELTIERFTIDAGETKEVTVNLTGSQPYIGFQLDVYLPKGITVATEANGRVQVSGNAEMRNGHSLSGLNKGGGHYRFVVFSSGNNTFKSTSGSLLDLTLTASDQVSTGEQVIRLTQQYFTNVSFVETAFADAEYPFEVQLNTAVSSLGYASFSWPVGLDFSSAGVRAYIAQDYADGSIRLVEVTRVPANTGLILNASAGEFQLKTLADDASVDDVTGNLLTGTADGDYVIDQDNVYVLSNLNGPGLYRAGRGVTIRQYKAYMVLPATVDAREGFTFDMTSAIESTLTPSQQGREDVYDLCGRRIQSDKETKSQGDTNYQLSIVNYQLPKGVYIVGGKKHVVR